MKIKIWINVDNDPSSGKLQGRCKSNYIKTLEPLEPSRLQSKSCFLEMSIKNKNFFQTQAFHKGKASRVEGIFKGAIFFDNSSRTNSEKLFPSSKAICRYNNNSSLGNLILVATIVFAIVISSYHDVITLLRASAGVVG